MVRSEPFLKLEFGRADWQATKVLDVGRLGAPSQGVQFALKIEDRTYFGIFVCQQEKVPKIGL
jgi:hypothetical protein